MRLRTIFCVFMGLLPVTSMAEMAYFSSIEDAKEAIVLAEAHAAKLKEEYLQQDAACLDRFFVTNCREEVKNTYLENKALNDNQRLQAEHYIREARYQEMQQRVLQKEQEANQRQVDASDSTQKYADKQAEYEQRQASYNETPKPNPRQRPQTSDVDKEDPAKQAASREAYEQKLKEAEIYAKQQEQRRQQAIEDRQRRIQEREAAIAQEKQMTSEQRP